MAYPTAGSRTGFMPVSSGNSLSATNEDTLGTGLVGYAEITTNSAYFAQGSSVLVTGLAVTITAAANRMYAVTVGAAGFSIGPPGGPNIGTWEMIAWDGTGLVGLASQIVIPQGMSFVILDTATTGTSPSAATFPGSQVTGYHQPAAGSQTYSMRLQGTGGGSTCSVLATASGSSRRTAYIRVFDVGPAF